MLSFIGGLGDQLFLTTVARELRKREHSRIWISSRVPEIFENNSDIQRVVREYSEYDFWFVPRIGGKNIRPNYAPHIAAERRDMPPEKHILGIMCEQSGIKGAVELRPYLNLTKMERSRGRLFDRQIVIQSTGSASSHFMRTKEWYPERFQEVVNALKNEFQFIQIGSKNDARLEGTHDLRGKTSIRETAALLSNSFSFVGLVGFLMHLARAVECRAVIVYGGRELPSQSGYPCNINLTGQTSCAPCWRYDDCPGNRTCMDQIVSARVVDAVREVVERRLEVLETERLEL